MYKAVRNNNEGHLQRYSDYCIGYIEFAVNNQLCLKNVG